VLLAEDDPTLATLLTELLVDEGYVVTGVTTADEALREAATGAHDLLLVDTFTAPGHATLPPEDIAFLRALAAHAPVVVMSARQWALHADPAPLGAAAIIPKPFQLQALLDALQAARRARG
jgi:DNA-binding response OmpR family regulator